MKTRRPSFPASSCLKRRLSIKSAPCAISAGINCYELSSDLANRLSKVIVSQEGQAAAISYLHNANGQRTFKSEPKADQYQPNEEELGTDFVTWLKKNFSWLFAQAQADASIGTAYSYADPDAQLPSWALLGEYDNGSAAGKGRTEYIWLPTDDGSAIPLGLVRNGKFFAIHTDHLGTPRLMTNEQNAPVWQWPYSAFGNNKPTGVLKATPNPRAAMTNNPVLLRATGAVEMNLRFPGQYADDETGQFYNYFRSYQPNQGRYTQFDPIGLAGGLNGYQYVEGNPLMFHDPLGLQAYPPRYSPLNPQLYGRLNPQERSPAGTPAPAVNQATGAAADFLNNYRAMRTANTIGADKYFHCKANCQASRRGRAGKNAACMISDSREWFDQTVKGDPASASQANQAANLFGGDNIDTAGSCDVVWCAAFTGRMDCLLYIDGIRREEQKNLGVHLGSSSCCCCLVGF